MKKRLLALLLTLALLLCTVPGLGEQQSSLSAARINDLQKLAGEDGAQWREGTAPSPDMNAFQLWQWTDWFLANRVRSLLGAIQDYGQLNPGGALDADMEADQWQLRALETLLSCYETQLEEDRLAILNGISLCQRSETSQAERQAAISRILEAESELRQIIAAICRDCQTYVALADDCSSRLRATYGGYTLYAHRLASADLAASAETLENSENTGNADIHVSVSPTSQFHIRLLDSDRQPVPGATVTVVNPLNRVQAKITTGSQGDAAFWVSDLGADETGKLQLSLRVEAEGYRTREMQTVRLRSGETRTVELQKDNGEPYLIMGCFNGRDILTETNTFYGSPANTAKHTFTVKLHCDQDGTLELRYPVDAKADEFQTVVKRFVASDSDSTVMVFEDQWLSKLVPDTRVSFAITTGGAQYTTDTQLVIQKALVDAPVLSRNALFSFDGMANSVDFSIPGNAPFIGGSRLSLDIPETLARAVYLPSYQALYALGDDFKAEQANWQTRDAEDEAKALKAFEVKGKADEALAQAGAYRDINTTTQTGLLGGQSAYVTPYASLQGPYRTNSSTLELSGAAGAALGFHADISQTFSTGTVPFFAGMTLDMSSGFGLDAASIAKVAVTDGVPNLIGAPKISYASDSDVSLRTDMRTTSGMGVRDDVNVDFSGYGCLSPMVAFTKSGTSATATLDMGMYATVRKLFTKWKSVAWEGQLSLGENAAASTPDTLISSMPVNERVEPQSEVKLFIPLDNAADELDIAADEAQFATIGTDTYMFWIQPGIGDQVPHVNWYNLSELTKYLRGEITLSQVSHGEVNYLQGGQSVPQRQRLCSDYAFALEAREDYCALTILSGAFPSAGSGEEPAPPSKACVATVLMWRYDGSDDPQREGDLEMKGYQEWSTFNQGVDYPILPEVHLLENNGILSAYVTAGSPEKISSQLYAYDSTYRDWTGAFLQNTQSLICADAAEITRFRIADVSAAGPQQFYSLSRTSMTEDAQGALSRLIVSGNACTREVLAQGNIINFRVAAQPDTRSATDRLFYLERVELETGKYTQRLKGVTVVRTGSSANPVITDYDVEISADSFDIVRFGSGVYLYWTECSAPTDAAGQGIQEAYLVRCVRYDPGTDTVSGPFTLVELSERPHGVKLLDDGTGYYSVDLQSSPGSCLRQSVSRFTYKLVSAAEVTAAAFSNPCVSAGDYAEIVFSVRNTGNVPLSGLDVKISNDSEPLQMLHIDCTSPENNSSTIGARAMNGAHTVSRIGSLYDPLNHDSWDIVRTQANGTATLVPVQTTMLMPGDTHSYTARVLVPTDWQGRKSLNVTIDRVEGSAGLTGAMSNGTLLLTGVKDPNATTGVISRPGMALQTLNTDAHDLSLSAQRIKRSDGDYVHITIRNLSGNTESAVTPVLTASYRGETLYSHTFRNPMGDGFGYSVDIPLATLTKGRSLQELELHVSGKNGYEEFADSDNHVRLLLSVQLYIAEQPVSMTVSEGMEAMFSVTANGGKQPYRYQWQMLNAAGRWVDIQGADQETCRIEAATSEHNGLTVRCVVTDQHGDSVLSDEAALLVLPKEEPIVPPKTGDDTPVMLWFLMVLSSAAVLMLLWRRRYSR